MYYDWRLASAKMCANMSQMKAAFQTGKEQIEVRDAPMPEPAPGEVLIRVRVCGVCGTDLHSYSGHLPSMPNVSPGHEFAGEVVEAAEGFAAGERVAIEPLTTCRTCTYCLTGRYHLCPGRAAGGVQAGGMAEYIAAPAYSLYRLPDELDFELGALVEPVAVAVHGAHMVGVTVGERVLVLGSGTIGLTAILAARAAGASEVIATFRYEHQGQAALAAGASRIVEVEGAAGLASEDIDVVIETVGGTAPTVGDALRSVRPGGRISILGVFTQPIKMHPLGMMLKEVKMVAPITYCRPGLHSDFDAAIGILRADPERARALITHRVALADTAGAFTTAADKKSGSIKVQLEI
ncbi:MAG: alcohol dehydrogenase catalytic domain-containing protein [Chloroflexi bacterium]|nr:alcohol dehydrogenase catalytic domain-containing protein [Chloroflexota bacterium]